jgi:glycopeptide antibiotics resistance protein
MKKMNDNEKFMSKWKPIHEKAMVKYVILPSLIALLIVSLTTIIVIWTFPQNQTKIYYLIVTIALLYLMFIVRKTLYWFSGEKRYRKIINKEF